MKFNATLLAGQLKNFQPEFFVLLLLFFICVKGNAQQYTENFSSAPAFTPDPNTPAWMEKATVTQGRTVYDFISGGNGGWQYKTTGGLGNSANLFYSTSATTSVIIKRRDGKRFQFYGAWLSYINYVASYTPPWLKVTYEGSLLTPVTYDNNSTVTLSQNINVTSVTLYFSGLHELNFDNITVGPPIPIPPISTTDEVVTITENTAVLSGSVTDDGGASVSESGLVYGTTAAPTIADTKLALSSGVNTFSQMVAGLQSSTTYFVRSYAINSSGTAYGNEASFTTFGNFTGSGSHNFNTSWASTANQNSPFTKFVEGWDVTGVSTGTGLVSVYRLTDADAAEGVSSLRVAANDYTQSLVYLSLKTHNLSLFNLKNFVFRYDAQQIGEGASYGTITLTGFKNGAAVPGAIQNITSISPLSDAPAYHTFTTNSNIFNDIDEFRLTASDPVNGARLYGFDLDEIVTTTDAILPVTFTSIKAYQKINGIEVEWNVATESNVNHYLVQKSSNGTKFTDAGEVLPESNDYSAASYNWFDQNVNKGKNYYRVKSVFKTGSFSYSPVMSIVLDADKGSLSVYPNPVTGSSIYLRLSNQPKGTYTIQLINIRGQLLLNTTFVYTGGSLTRALEPGNSFITGMYQLKVTSPSGSYIQKIIKD